MVKQNRNTIDGLVDKTAVNNKSPDDLCFDPSDASITPFSDKRGMRTKSWTPKRGDLWHIQSNKLLQH